MSRRIYELNVSRYGDSENWIEILPTAPDTGILNQLHIDICRHFDDPNYDRCVYITLFNNEIHLSCFVDGKWKTIEGSFGPPGGHG